MKKTYHFYFPLCCSFCSDYFSGCRQTPQKTNQIQSRNPVSKSW